VSGIRGSSDITARNSAATMQTMRAAMASQARRQV
jgi:hypothetical protein